jgi:hypothetical protein
MCSSYKERIPFECPLLILIYMQSTEMIRTAANTHTDGKMKLLSCENRVRIRLGIEREASTAVVVKVAAAAIEETNSPCHD